MNTIPQEEANNSQDKAKLVIDAILKNGTELLTTDAKYTEGYTVHTDDWVNYTDYAEYTENK